jgi:hypothetical protein
MKRIFPKIKTTETSPDLREWLPTNFDNVMREIEHVSKHCEGDDPLALFRGHADYQWRLDCTLVRTMLAHKPALTPSYPRPLSFHTKITDIILAKLGKLTEAPNTKLKGFWRLSDEALEKELTHGIDPWFELMKKLQQYAEKDSEPKGTFLIDWTIDPDIAIYFATYVGRRASRVLRDSHGAVWIWDPHPTGKVLMTKKLGEILTMMRADAFRVAAGHSTPLILHPSKQTRMLRAMGQKPVYVSQMDYRYDLADVWCGMEERSSSAMFKKIILTSAVLQESVLYLQRHNIDEQHVYPE